MMRGTKNQFSFTRAAPSKRGRPKSNFLSVKHLPSEVKVFNHPLTNLSDVLQLSSGQAWKTFTISDLAQMVDHFAYEALNFDFVGNYQGGDFLERNGTFESRHQEESGVWQFTKVARGDYLLTILGDQSTQFSGNEKVQVSVKTDNQQDFTLPVTIFFTTQGIIFYGKIDFLKDPSQLTLPAQRPVNGGAQKGISYQ